MTEIVEAEPEEECTAIVEQEVEWTEIVEEVEEPEVVHSTSKLDKLQEVQQASESAPEVLPENKHDEPADNLPPADYNPSEGDE